MMIKDIYRIYLSMMLISTETQYSVKWKYISLALFRMDLFVDAEICHTYPAMMKRGTAVPYLKKIHNIYKPPDTTREFY